MERLDKIVASTGLWSRKDAKILAKKGLIKVNGTVVKSPDIKVNPQEDTIIVDGKELSYNKNLWLMLNKPAGYVTATTDAREKTVMELLPRSMAKRNLFPVGRLDKDTEGLLLLTNDGAAAHRLLSPKYHVDKVYFARVSGLLTGVDVEAFKNGMELEDGTKCQSAELEIVNVSGSAPADYPHTKATQIADTSNDAPSADVHSTDTPITEACITIREGKYHQIKRMMAALGKKVIYLERIKMGGLSLDPTLKRGDFRELTPMEIESL